MAYAAFVHQLFQFIANVWVLIILAAFSSRQRFHRH
jgi:hypothetical protein